MHYYKKNIGDYRAATAHLTLLEHGVYNWLIDTYYVNEQPLPLDERTLFRTAGARTEDEKQAVRDILDEFFAKTEAGWVHKRCDKEILAYQAKANNSRANGGKGGRPAKETESEPEQIPENNPEETQQVISDNPEETLTKNQEPLTNIKKENAGEAENSEQPEWSPPLTTLNHKLKLAGGEAIDQTTLDQTLVLFNPHYEGQYMSPNKRLAKLVGWILDKQRRSKNFSKPQAAAPQEPEQPAAKPQPNVDRFHNPAAVPPPADLFACLKGGFPS